MPAILNFLPCAWKFRLAAKNIPKNQKSKLWKLQKSKKPNFGKLGRGRLSPPKLTIQTLDFWVFGFFGFLCVLGFWIFGFLVLWTNLLSEERMSKANPKIQKSKNPKNKKTKKTKPQILQKTKNPKVWRGHLFTLSVRCLALNL